MKKNISIGLLGLGEVGSGVAKLVNDYQDDLVHQLGCTVTVKRALVRNVEEVRNVHIDKNRLTTDPSDIIADPEIDIVVEVMGGVDLPRQLMLDAFKANKHVVTANKDLMALHGPELEQAAVDNGCDLFYEASVGGGIPLLRSLTDGLASDRIQQVMGIVNGTTNYILTKMDMEGATYDDALKEAQALGFAEADPTADVEGLDAARKMVILARLAFLTDVELTDVEVKGISSVAQVDLEHAKQLGYTMKLIGYAKRDGEHVEVSVQPTLLKADHPLAHVNNEYNAVYFSGESVGETMFYGPGAGGLPTATAIMADVIAVIKNIHLNTTGKNMVKQRFQKETTPLNKRFSQYYVRVSVKDEATEAITALFREYKINLTHIAQTTEQTDGVSDVVLMTETTAFDTFQAAREQLSTLAVVDELKGSYRIEGDDN